MNGKQISFSQFQEGKVRAFGGSLVRGNPRERRPISLKRPLHLVMRSSLARGDRSFLLPKRARRIRAIVDRAASRHGVKLYRFANSGNHLHLVVLPRSRAAFQGFIRSVTGLIARATLGVERGHAKGMKGSRRSDQVRSKRVKFWDARPFTRIIEWGRDYKRVSAYLRQNVLEAFGFIPYKPRAHPRPQSAYG